MFYKPHARHAVPNLNLRRRAVSFVLPPLIFALAIAETFSMQDYGKPYKELDALEGGIVDVKVTHETKPNRYDSAKDTLTLTAAQVNGLELICGAPLGGEHF